MNSRHIERLLVSVVFIFAACVPVARAAISVVVPINNINATFDSVPIAWDANPLRFAPFSGLLVLANLSSVCIPALRAQFPPDANLSFVIAETYPGYTRPYVENRIVRWARELNPSGAIFMGEYAEGVYYELGILEMVQLGIDTHESKFPIVQTHWTSWYSLRHYLSNCSVINVTVDDQGVNSWRSSRSSWWFGLWIAVLIVWSLANIGLSARGLALLPCTRIISVVVLWLEVAANIMRIIFLIDPFGVWWIPISMIHVFILMNVPLHIATAVLVILFWLELVDRSNIKTATGFLTSTRYPAAAIIVIAALGEYITAAFRAAGYNSALLSLNFAIYAVIMLFCLVLYLYVYAKVFSFLRGSSISAQRKRDKILRKVSLRLLISALTFPMLIAVAGFALSRWYAQAVGQGIIIFGIYTVISISSTSTIAAILHSAASKHKSTAAVSSSAAKSGTASSNTVHSKS